MRLTLLQSVLTLLEFAGLVGDFAAFVASPVGLAVGLCGVSYQLLLLGGCDPLSSAILAIAVALCFHTVTQKPKF